MTLIPKFEPLEDRIVLDGTATAPVADVSFDGPADVQLGEQDVAYTLTFDNTGGSSGYVPYAELVIPTSGLDGEGDGPTFDSATFLGTPLTPTVSTFNSQGEVEHPFLTDASGDPLVVNGNEGDTIVFFELPYGSFSQGNPPVEIDVLIDFDENADLAQVPTFETLGGFALGCDAEDNPDTDPAIRGTATSTTTTQSLFEVTKVNSGPQEEGATGPSYVYTYDMTVDIAPGQTLDDFVLTDNLPPEIVYLGVTNISGGVNPQIDSEPTVGDQVQPGEQLIVSFDSVTGTVTVSFDYYISNTPSDTAGPTNDPVTGAPAAVVNAVTGEGDWTPLDPDDAQQSVSDSATNTITASTLAVQKSNALVEDNNAPGASPGDVYEFTLDIQVSDYFTFGDINIADELGDGWQYQAGSAAFFVTEEAGDIGTEAAPVSLAGFETVTNNTPSAGVTTLGWDLSAAMAAQAGSDGLLVGDIAGDGTADGAQTIVTVTYRAVIRDEYDNPGGGLPSINQGDLLSNLATVSGTVRDNADPTIVNDIVSNTGDSSVRIATGEIESKTVFALNGDTTPGSDTTIAAGDQVTFSIIYNAPLDAFEDFRIEDNLPQLVFDAGEVIPATAWQMNPADRTAPPAPGEAYFGPNTSTNLLGQAPVITIDGPNNGITFDFDTFTNPTPQAAKIEILFTVTVEDAIFAPELLLTNQATAFESNTFGEEISSIAIAQFNYGEPSLNITKGVIANTTAGSSATITGPVGLPGVTDPGTAGPRFSGTVSSGVLDGAPLNVDANIEDVDAGDIVTFAVVLENEGSAPNGAFNISLTDTVPVGFDIPTGPAGYNLTITDGTGAAIAFTRPDGSPATAADYLGGAGIVLVDDGPLQGAASVFSETSGENIIIITYDLLVTDTTSPSSSMTNVASIAEYNAFEGTPADPPVNRVVGTLSDDAVATTKPIEINKIIDADSRQFDAEIGNRGFSQVAVGETFDFLITVDVPEGTMFNTVISDRVTNGGLTLVDAEIITMGTNLNSSTGVVQGDTVTAVGNEWSFDLGTLFNSGDNDDTNDQIVIRVSALAADDDVGSAGHFMRNLATIEFQNATGDTISDSDGANARLIEPDLDLTKTASPALVAAGGTVSYEIEIDNPAASLGAPAFDVELNDVLDDQVNLDVGSVVVTRTINGVSTTLTAPADYVQTITLVPGGNDELNITLAQINERETITVSYTGTVVEDVDANTLLENIVGLTFDSTPEDDSALDNDDRDYSLTTSADVRTNSPNMEKEVVDGSSSYAETTGNELGIGETVTYEFTITVPDGATDALVLTDTLPAGMQYISSEIVSIGSDITVDNGAVGAFGTNGGGAATVFDFGNVLDVFDTDADPADPNDQIVVRLTAQVVATGATPANGDDLVNVGTVTFTDGEGDTQTVEDDATVTVVEPDMIIAKSVTPTDPDAGDTVSYAVTATNDGDGPAYDLLISDNVVGPDVVASSATLRIEDENGVVVTPAGVIVPTFDGAGALTAAIDALEAGHVVIIEYDAVVQDTALMSSTLTNTAEITSYDSNPSDVPADEDRDYTGPIATADITTPDASLEKNYLSSSDSNTADESGPTNAQLNVGETVTYELIITVPQGTADITLGDNLPAGLIAQSAEVVSIGDAGTDTSANLVAGETDTTDPTNIVISGTGDQVTFNFGTVVIQGSDDLAATDTQIVVRVTALVDDVAAATAGASLENTATLTLRDPANLGTTLQPPVTASETVDIVEPDLEIDKTGPVGADPGEVIEYQIVVTNTGDGPAYDVVIEDPFTDPNLLYQTGLTVVPAGGTLVELGGATPNGFTLSGLTLLPGETVTLTFDVQINPAAPEAQTFINDAEVTFDSVDGAGGRVGTDSDDHRIATVPFIEKTPISSSFAETDSTLGSDPFDLSIGEEVTYSYTITLPEIGLDSVTVVDTLPAGMEFVSATFIEANGTGHDGTFDVVQVGNVISIDFGAMVNPSDGSIGTDDEMVFELVARVTELTNAGDPPLTNSIDLDVTPTLGTPFATQAATADVRVVEPEVAIDKTGPAALDPGGPAGLFTITVTNDGVTGAAGPAYDIDITDLMDAGLTLDQTSLVFADQNGNPLTTDGAPVTSASGFTAEFSVLDVGDSIVITYRASLDAGSAALTEFGNDASADFHSAPEDLLGEDGMPVARDYTPVTDDHDLWSNATLDKTAQSTGLTETPENADSDGALDLTIGETVTYALTITLPEIAMDSLVLRDTLPAGLSFVSAEVSALGAEITVDGGTDLTAINAAATPATAGQDMTITLLNVVNADVGGITADDTITILVTARVDDLAAVTGALPANSQLTNEAGLTITPAGADAFSEITDTATVEVVEPALTIEKEGNIAVNPGDPVDYVITVTNDGSGPAFDLIVEDTLGNPFLSLQTGTVQILLDTDGDGTDEDITGSVAVIETATGFRFELDDTATGLPFALDPGETLTVNYTATLSLAAPEAQTFLNTATVDYDSLPGDPVDENGNPVPDRDYTADDGHSVATVPFLTKTPTASSFGETDSINGSDPFNLAIGEEVTFTYELFLPEIPMRSVVFEDNLPDGLEFVSFTADYTLTDLTALDGSALGQPTLTEVSTTQFLLDFGGINNPEDANPPTIGPDDVILVTVVARVGDDGLASAGDTLTNNAALEVTPSTGPLLDRAEASADVRIVEPELDIAKTGPVAINPGERGDYQITLVNSGPDVTPSATGPAYDVEIEDVMPAGLALVPSTLNITLNGVAYTPAAGELVTAVTGFTLNFDVLLPDDEVVISYSAELDATSQPLTPFTNTVSAAYDSAPGDPPLDADGNPTEQTYTPAVAEHTLATLPTLEKTTIASGFSETAEDADGDDIRDLQIGETVTYELVLTLPEIAMDTVAFTDSLPDGLAFVSAQISAIGSTIAVDGSTDLAAINAANMVSVAGQDLSLTLADVLNSGTDGTGLRADDAIVLQIVARVEDIANNVDGAELTNSAGLIVDPAGPDGPLFEVTDETTIEIVEPDLTIEKTGEVAGDAGGAPLEYSIAIENTGTGTAFDVIVSDPHENPHLTYEDGSVQVFLNGVLVAPQPIVFSPVPDGTDGFEIVIDALAPDDILRVDYTARIDADAPAAATFENTASVDYFSTPEPTPEERSYGADDTHTVTGSPGLEKTAFTSSFPDTPSEQGDSPFELGIGETVTYRYVLTLPELALDSVVLTDNLPAGLEFISAQIVDVNGTGASGTLSTSVDAGNANLLTFDFGAMTNASDGSIGADDDLIFEVTARVLADGSANAGDVLTNTASLAVDPDGDDPFEPIEAAADVSIVEPELQIAKIGPDAIDPGDTASYGIFVANTGNPNGAGPAYDVAVTDALPAGMTLDAASLEFNLGGEFVTPTSLVTTDSGFTAEFGLLPADAFLVITYDATLSAGSAPLTSFINTATAEYDGAPGDLPGRVYDPVSDTHVLSTGPTLEKSALSTGFDETPEDGDGDGILGATIGETVTYSITLTLPEIPMDRVVISDTLPDGLTFISGEITSIGSEISINGDLSLVDAGQVLTLTLTDVINAYVDGTITTDQDAIVISVTARVDDIATNTSGAELTNTASLSVTPIGADPLDQVIDTATVEVIEPNVSVVKTASDISPMLGDTFSYTFTVTNAADATSPAFNTVLVDNFPFEMTLTGNFTLSDPALGTVSPTSVAGGTQLLVTIPVLQPGQSFTITAEVELGFLSDVLQGLENTASVSTNSTPIENDPNGRDYGALDTAIIVAQPVPTDDDGPRTNAIDGIDDARFLPVILIDPIFTGTAEPGSNVTINLYRQDGSLDYVRNIVADMGGHWIAIFPRVEFTEVYDDFNEEYRGSVLFDAPIRTIDTERNDTMNYERDARTSVIGTQLIDGAYTLGVSADRPSTLPQDAGMFNTRTFFAPAHIGEIYGNDDVLKVDEIFQNIAFRTVEDMYQSSADPLGASLNRFNYEFLSAQTAVPGSQ